MYNENNGFFILSNLNCKKKTERGKLNNKLYYNKLPNELNVAEIKQRIIY